jgi:hypothetical protein
MNPLCGGGSVVQAFRPAEDSAGLGLLKNRNGATFDVARRAPAVHTEPVLSLAGQFATSLHDIVVDSTGNFYTGEAATGGRIQKFRVEP